jgi:hypothetical protein
MLQSGSADKEGGGCGYGGAATIWTGRWQKNIMTCPGIAGRAPAGQQASAKLAKNTKNKNKKNAR